MSSGKRRTSRARSPTSEDRHDGNGSARTPASRHARRFLFCDTNAWTTLQWSLRSYGTADARLHELVDRTVADYTWFLCANDFGWIQDGTREMVGAASGEFQEQQIRDLERRGIPYVTVSGPVEERVEQVMAR